MQTITSIIEHLKSMIEKGTPMSSSSLIITIINIALAMVLAVGLNTSCCFGEKNNFSIYAR